MSIHLRRLNENGERHLRIFPDAQTGGGSYSLPEILSDLPALDISIL